MTPKQNRGQDILIVYIALLLFLSASVTTLYVLRIGTDRLFAQIVRFIVTAFLCLWLYRGSVVARIINILMYGLGGLSIIWLELNHPNGNVIGMIDLWLLGGVYLSFAVVLLTSSSVAEFFMYQRGEAPNSPPPSGDLM